MIYQQGFPASTPEAEAIPLAVAGYEAACLDAGITPSDEPDISIIRTPEHEAAGEYLVRVATPGSL